MHCQKCSKAMAYTGVSCLCGHKQYVCPGCKHIWSYNHNSGGGYYIDWDAENKMKGLVKDNQKKSGIKSYEEYIEKRVSEWRRNLR